MSAQLANGGHKIEPKIIYNEQALQPNKDVLSERFKQIIQESRKY